jgi:hypothetical protein
LWLIIAVGTGSALSGIRLFLDGVGYLQTAQGILENRGVIVGFIAQIALSMWFGPGLALACLVIVLWLTFGQRLGVARASNPAAKLAAFHQDGIDKILCHAVETIDDQNTLEGQERAWRDSLVSYMHESQCDPSDIAKVNRISPYNPKGLGALVKGFNANDPEKVKLAERNAKIRNEITERLERLMAVIEKTERRI